MNAHTSNWNLPPIDGTRVSRIRSILGTMSLFCNMHGTTAPDYCFLPFSLLFFGNLLQEKYTLHFSRGCVTCLRPYQFDVGGKTCYEDDMGKYIPPYLVYTLMLARCMKGHLLAIFFCSTGVQRYHLSALAIPELQEERLTTHSLKTLLVTL